MDKSDILCYNTEKSIEDIDAAMQSYFFKQYSTYDKEYGNKDWLYINNFGFYRNLTKSIRTSRAVPRADYHLLYVASGEVSVNGALLQSGDAYLFLPNEPHAYTYKPAEGSLYYWVHFTGNRVAELLSRGEIAGGVNKSNERKTEKDEILSLLTAELGKCAEEASRYAVSLFFSFLCLFEGGCRRRFYAKALRELESMTGNATVGEIAKLYGISTAHFIRSFKEIHGVAPNEYRRRHRLSHAMNLLKMTNLSVQDIASQCGFGDAFYFSRFFKKATGFSPSDYRKT